jgi:competence protein ComEC
MQERPTSGRPRGWPFGPTGRWPRRLAGWRPSWLRSEPLPERPLVVLAAALAGGCGIAASVDPPPVGCWLLAVVALAAWAAAARWRRPGLACGFLVAAVAGGGAAWCAARASLFAADDLAWSLSTIPQPVAVEGIVVEAPRSLGSHRIDGLRGEHAAEVSRPPVHECVIEVRAIRRGSRWRPASGRAALVTEGEPDDIHAGCRVQVFGRGLRPPPPSNPGEFDFRGRARSLRCLSIVRADAPAGVKVLSGPPAWSAGGWIEAVRARGVEVLCRHVSAERAPLAAALLLGSRESLPREESQDFLVTGTIHILSISGLHVGFLALALFKGLRLFALPRGASLAAVASCTGLYMLLVRAETPVVRATLLVWTGCLAAACGRRAGAGNSLALAAILVMLVHPPELLRLGAQLSFLSTAVLIGASTALSRSRGDDDPIARLVERSRAPLERRLRRAGRLVWEVALTGAAVWAATAPLVAATCHLVSPVGLVLNPLVAPLVALAMAWGFLCLAAAPLSDMLAAGCGWACDATLRCIAACVAWAADLPGGFFWVAGPPPWWVVGWYVLLAATALLANRESLARIGTWVYVAAAWAGVGICIHGLGNAVWPRPPALRAMVASMGHGLGIVVRSPTGRCLVYDAGRLGAPAAARRAMAAVLWSEGVTRIDTLVVSHADADHFNAVPELLERFSIGEIIVPPQFLESTSWAARELVRLAGWAGVPLRPMQAGDSFAVDPLCRARVLHPAPPPPRRGKSPARPAPPPDGDNQTSLVLSLECAGRRILLTGDIEGPALERFVASAPDPCDVLVAPHHGSRTSLPPDIARVTRPDWVIVSGPGAAGWRMVRDAYARARGDGVAATVLKTGGVGAGGAIAISLAAGGVGVAQYADGRWRAVSSDADRSPLRSRAARRPRQASPGAVLTESSSESGRVNTQPTAIRSNWLATKPASRSSTPLVKP